MTEPVQSCSAGSNEPQTPTKEDFAKWSRVWNNTCNTILEMLDLPGHGSPDEMIAQVSHHLDRDHAALGALKELREAFVMAWGFEPGAENTLYRPVLDRVDAALKRKPSGRDADAAPMRDPAQGWRRPLATISEEEIERVAQAIERSMFAPHELPLSADLHLKYRATAVAAINAAQPPAAPVETGLTLGEMAHYHNGEDPADSFDPSEWEQVLERREDALHGSSAGSAIAALAKRFWSIHPKEIQDMGITREQFYEREMLALFATQPQTSARGVCCYCDAPLCCAACGREQPDDSADLPQEALRSVAIKAIEAYRRAQSEGEVVIAMENLERALSHEPGCSVTRPMRATPSAPDASAPAQRPRE